MPQILSERIAALRKERGLTQEQLGRLVGVSSQAVGKWEKGGAPDVELLPILSRQLGVTIDALFGLEDGPREAVQDTLARYLRELPSEERMGQFCRLVWACVGAFLPDGLDTRVGEGGSSLSGGQKQRVALARALIHGRSILLVDEGTSALDPQNAEIVEQSLLADPELTLILVSHHLTPQRRAQFTKVYELQPVPPGL